MKMTGVVFYLNKILQTAGLPCYDVHNIYWPYSHYVNMFNSGPCIAIGFPTTTVRNELHSLFLDMHHFI